MLHVNLQPLIEINFVSYGFSVEEELTALEDHADNSMESDEEEDEMRKRPAGERAV